MSVHVMVSEGNWVPFEDEEKTIYEWAEGRAGELYIVAREPGIKSTKERTILFEGRYIEMLFSSIGWLRVEGDKCIQDATQLGTSAF